MTNDQILAYGTLLLAASTAVSIVLGFIFYRRQCNVQVFLEYTKRYADIMNMFPSEGRKARLDLFGEPPPESDELSLSVLRYLNLCSEEFYLCKKKYLSIHVWEIWEAELKRTLGSTLVVREWARLRDEFQAYPEFLEYVEIAQRQACAGALTSRCAADERPSRSQRKARDVARRLRQIVLALITFHTSYASCDTSTSRASICQCRGCSQYRPARMSAA